MQELDTLTNEQIVMAATNREDRLDPALKRRFYQREEIIFLRKKNELSWYLSSWMMWGLIIVKKK